MYYELALISVLIAGGYWGWYFFRHESTRFYGVLQLASAGLAGLGLLGRKLEQAGFGIGGAIGVGAGLCLLVLGPIARSTARRFAAAERFAAAKLMLDAAEVLAPGSGVADEKALLGAMREIRDGNIEKTVEALNMAKRGAPPDARLAIDERIAMLYLAAYRWDEAIAHAEEQLFGAIPPTSDADVPGPPQLALRRALGIAPPVWVELLGAYGYKGDLDQAARMLARLEDVCAGRPDANIWLHRGRLIFLALAGRVDAVQTLVEPRRSRHMKPAARTYWVAVAHERHGEKAAAEAAYAKARSRSRGRPRVLIDQALARLASASPLELGPTATEVVARVEAEPPPTVIERARPRGPIASRALALACIAAWVTVAIAFGSSSDLGVLVRDGSLVRGLTFGGEWWRVVSSIFVHIGGVHMIVNVLGLWMLGRLVEELFGPWRLITIFALAGIGGQLASALASPAGISSGASGGLFGLLGAVFVELSWHRDRHRVAWSRGVWGIVTVVTVAQLGIGFLYPAIDQWAHGGGLVIGALLGFALSPNAPWQRIAHHAARLVTVAFALLVLVTTVLVARTSIADSLENRPKVRRKAATISAIVPATWQRDQDQLFDPDIYTLLLAQRVPATDPSLTAQLDAYASGEEKMARSLEFEQFRPATERILSLPAGWESREMIAVAVDPLGQTQKFRVVSAARRDGDAVIQVSLYVPERIAASAPASFTDLFASIQAVER